MALNQSPHSLFELSPLDPKERKRRERVQKMAELIEGLDEDAEGALLEIMRHFALYASKHN